MSFFLELSETQLDQLAEIVARKLDARPAKDALSIIEAAEKTGVSKDTISRRIAAGLIPTIPGLSPVRIPSDFIARMMKTPTHTE